MDLNSRWLHPRITCTLQVVENMVAMRVDIRHNHLLSRGIILVELRHHTGHSNKHLHLLQDKVDSMVVTGL
jgi:hypothetical protein